ncbi:hypothetical protein GUITHDRAFT_107811 [Guillardia theta CCMP2712]|uniref:EF-hand domain-containing protein n=1 Tax=Guillardia theta (strain CCMP2712) TaxID=905079 RepID=L1JCC1_GUITC|nr:hypothetical protein GUITHDRAFT_107811 [Guillardia theta CCMP2712]EKX46193.1 hypothetical protein GUITHDRAFT_107811 [Guillardia theta CCMP2712]|eukprot:XP_005833173.1 hypothetical protein GUITHDRAFT_107811 [Guillardia theta CCMP2712]
MVTIAGVIPQTVIDRCEAAFSEVDQDRCGAIDLEDLTRAFQTMGYKNSEDRALHDLLQNLEQEFDGKTSKYFDFQEFLSLTIEYLKIKADQENNEIELISAFRTLMGSEAESISSESVENVVKQYEMNVDFKSLFGVQMGGNKEMNLRELRHALMDGPGYDGITEKPYHKEENVHQKYWVNEITQDAWEESVQRCHAKKGFEQIIEEGIEDTSTSRFTR